MVALNEQVLYSRIDSGVLRPGTLVFVDRTWSRHPEEQVRTRYAESIGDFRSRGFVIIEVPIESNAVDALANRVTIMGQ